MTFPAELRSEAEKLYRLVEKRKPLLQYDDIEFLDELYNTLQQAADEIEHWELRYRQQMEIRLERMERQLQKIMENLQPAEKVEIITGWDRHHKTEFPDF